MYEILLESPLYEHIFKKGFDQGFQEGRQLVVLRQAIVKIVQERFPGLVQLAEQQIAMMDNLEHVYWLIVKVGTAANEEDIRRYLLTTDPITSTDQ